MNLSPWGGVIIGVILLVLGLVAIAREKKRDR
jgi:hypothetical protein